MVYLKSKKSDQISGVELYVRELFVKQKSTDWYPVQNTMFLEGGEESAEDGVMEQLKLLMRTMEQIDNKLKGQILTLGARFKIVIKEKRHRNPENDYEFTEDEETEAQQNDQEHLDPDERELFEEFYADFKEKELQLEALADMNQETEQGMEIQDKSRQQAKDRRKRAKDLWKEKKLALGKEMEVIDTWKNKIVDELGKLDSQMIDKVPSGQPSSAETNTAALSQGADKKDSVSKSGSSGDRLPSIMDKVGKLVNIQAS